MTGKGVLKVNRDFLVEQIAQQKKELWITAEKYGFSSPETLLKNETLDKLLNQYMGIAPLLNNHEDN
jgi:hypothetical protein